MWRTVAAVALVLMAGCSDDSTDAGDTGKGCAATVHVFLNSDVTRGRERRIGQLIDDVAGVRDYSFHSRDEEFEEFKRQYRKEPEIYETKKRSDFPARYEVTLEPGSAISDFEIALTGATTGIDGIVPGGCATEAP